MFYSLGGYFVIEGRITLGALVAVLAAHKDFSAPLKELFNYYQALEDTRIRYWEITEFFAEKSELSRQKIVVGKVGSDARPSRSIIRTGVANRSIPHDTIMDGVR